MKTYDENTPVGALTVGQLFQIFEQKSVSILPEPKEEHRDDRVGIDDIQSLTGLSYSQLYKLTANNAIPHRKFGKRLVFSLKSVTEWMEMQTTGKETSKQKAARHLAKSAMKRTKN